MLVSVSEPFECARDRIFVLACDTDRGMRLCATDVPKLVVVPNFIRIIRFYCPLERQ